MAEIQNRLEEIDRTADIHWFRLTRFFRQGAGPTEREHICPNCYESVYLLSLRWVPERGKPKTKQEVVEQHQAWRKAHQEREAKRKAKAKPPPPPKSKYTFYPDPNAFVGPPSRQDLIRQWQEKFDKELKKKP